MKVEVYFNEEQERRLKLLLMNTDTNNPEELIHECLCFWEHMFHYKTKSVIENNVIHEPEYKYVNNTRLIFIKVLIALCISIIGIWFAKIAFYKSFTNGYDTGSILLLLFAISLISLGIYLFHWKIEIKRRPERV